jgi:hypothetical protein
MSQPGVQFTPQAGYANCYPTMSASYQPSASLVPMQGHMQAGFQNQASAAQSMNPFQQISGPQVAANIPIVGDRVPQRYVEGYQQAPPIEIQPVPQQEVDAFLGP